MRGGSRISSISLCAGALVVATLSYPLAAEAQESSAALANELFYAGRDLMNAGRYAEGCPKLAQSARLDAKVGTLARLAECDEKLGQMAAARAHWQQAENLARAQKDARLDHVAAELARVDKVVPKVIVSMVGAPPPGLSLQIDGSDVGAASLGLTLPVEAGHHTIAVSATGKKPYSTSLDTRADGGVSRITVPELEEGPKAVTPPSPTSAEGPPRPYWTPAREAGVVGGAAGALALAVGAVFGVQAKVELDRSNAPPDGCTGTSCGAPGSPGYADRTSAYHDGTIATVLLIAGGVVAASGVTLFLLSPGSREAQGPAVSLSTGLGGLIVAGRF